MRVKSEGGVEGGLYWVKNEEVGWRAEKYWEPGTNVTVGVEVGMMGDWKWGRSWWIRR